MHSDSPLVSVEWLVRYAFNPKLVLLDASMEQVIGTTPKVYEQPSFILGARQCDLENQFIDSQSKLPHSLPSADVFTQKAQALGIDSDSIVVIYDNQGIYSAPRAWWMFRSMGHEKVYVLDGGLPEWLRRGRTTRPEPTKAPKQGNIQGVLQPQNVCTGAQLLTMLDDPYTKIIDARSQARFYGQEPEPRPGLRRGHIRGSVNLHFLELMDGHCFAPPKEIAEKFEATGVLHRDKLVIYCGSGITACIVLLAAAIIGHQKLCLYDASWSEWGADDQFPIIE